MRPHILQALTQSNWIRMLDDTPQKWGVVLHPFTARPEHYPKYIIVDHYAPIDTVLLIQKLIENASFDYSITPLCLAIGERDDARGLVVGGWTLRRGELFREIFQAQIVLLPSGSMQEQNFQQNARDWEREIEYLTPAKASY